MRLLPVLAASALLAVPSAATAQTSITQAPLKTVKTAKGKVGYRSIGTGKPLVMVMGLSGTADSWDPAFVDALARGRRVITFDNAGIRRTAAPKGDLTIRAMGEQTAALIKALKLKRADVLGWSMGGMISQSLAVRHPELVRKLVLVATAPGDGKATGPQPAALAALGGNSSNPNALADMLFAGPGKDAAVAAYFGGVLRYPNAAPQAPPAVTAKQLGASSVWLMGQDPDGRKVRKLKLPVLVGGGEADPLLPVANQRRLGKIIKNAKLLTYPDTAHGFFVQAPAFVGEVRAFLR